MIFEHDELVELYNGPDNVPGQWLTVDELAEQMDTDPEEVRQLFEFYKIQERQPRVEILRTIWDILSDEWFMLWGEDFHYPAKVNHVEVAYYLEAEGVAFHLDARLQPKTYELFHIYNVNIFKFHPDTEPEVLAEWVRRVLKDHRVGKRSHSHVKAEKPGAW